MKHRIVILVVALLSGAGILSGQTLRQYITAAENALAQKDYFTAYTHFETAVGVDSNRMDLQYKLAETARLYQSYSFAETYYGNVLRSKDSESYPEAAYWLAKMQQMQGKYDDAITNYQIFVSEQADASPELIAAANRGIKASEWAKVNVQNVNDSTTVERLGANVNTLFSEFGGIQKDSNFYFTRLAFERHSLDKKGRPVYPALLYSQVLLSENHADGQPLDSTFNDELLHTAHTAFSHDNSRVYYTLCEYQNRSDVRCDLYYRDIIDGQWGEAHMLPSPINAEGFTSTQPNIGYNEETGKEILYFVSDRPGGKGNLDIWYCIINDPNNFTQPQPLAAVNTVENEMSPFYHNETKTLYFSSDGYEESFGGLDIYRTLNIGGVWGQVENIGPDVNSSYHDVYYTLSGDEKTAFYSSNKLGSIFFESSREACCFDIYEVSAQPVEVNLVIETFNKRTLAPLPYTTVTVIERNGEVITSTYNTEETNTITLPMKRNKNYTVIGSKEGYTPDTTRFSTYGITQSIDINKKLYLDPADVVVQVRTFDARRREPLPGTTVEIVDKDGISHGRKVNERTHIQYFGLPPVNTYTVTGSRKGYRNATATLTENDFTSDTIIVNLYLDLGNLEDFLPLAIYFDNDQPDPRTQRANTNLRYLQTYEPYYASKERFKRKYVKGVSRAEDAALEAQIDDFFENSLRRSKDEFESFLNILHQYLDEGLTFKIYLKGYTSPLASEAYNLQLGGRRIKTIQNEFGAFRGGVIARHFTSGNLEVLERSYGEEKAPANVSDNPRDARRSIYSPEASRERRVEIIEIEK